MAKARTTVRSAAALSLFSQDERTLDKASNLMRVAVSLTQALGESRLLSTALTRSAMCATFGGRDAGFAWTWKDAYEAVEVAQVLFLRKYGRAMQAHAGSPAAMLAHLGRLSERTPSQTKRSEEQQALQQFSTPPSLAYVASLAAGLEPGDVVLEPSAGTGLLAIWAELAGSRLILNELADTRAGLLEGLFADVAVTRHDAEQIDDRLGADLRPSVILMNPPFSVSPKVRGRNPEAALKHVASALARLEEGGRLVAITGANFSPYDRRWRDAFVNLQKRGRVAFSVALDGSAYARHGARIDTQLTVIDRIPAEDPHIFPPALGRADAVADLLDKVLTCVPPRRLTTRPAPVAVGLPSPAQTASAALAPKQPAPACDTALASSSIVKVVARIAATPVALDYAALDETSIEEGLSDGIYETYRLQRFRIPGAQPHPTPLVQSAAMASVAPLMPTHQPMLPPRIVIEGLLSEPQLESVIYAGQAHGAFLAGSWIVDETWDEVAAAPEGAQNAVRFRRGWFLGDGTGTGKGRQIAGVILDGWNRGRRKAVWISKNTELADDARRDWTALGGDEADIVPLSRYAQGAPIEVKEGVLFVTYATLRTEARKGKASRLKQIVDWLGRDFDGVIAFDEAHAMANAAGGKGSRGDVAPSQQGRAGLRLQNAAPTARVLYASATGATGVENLAYAHRLGLWGAADTPFPERSDFVTAMEAGGVAAMEVVARDLKALGLYAARSLSYDGVEYEVLEHALTDEQVKIYDAYAEAYQIIHHNLTAALEAANITGDGETYNRQAKSAARSAFEGNKQRFFSHLITAMKCPSLIAAMEADLAAGHAPLIQLTSTGEALLDRRLAEIPSEEWNDLNVDLTPREYLLDYLRHSFLVQLFEVRSDDEGNLTSAPAFDENGAPVLSREAIRRRDAMIERLASLAAVQSALDQVLHHFGTERVAEVTGRTRRVVRRPAEHGGDRLCVESRPASANVSEAKAFMDDEKQILVFSDAGGTGRSYHADLAAKNQRRRVHYVLEPGWRADAAVQGLGRSNRTRQRVPPLVRLVGVDVKGARRFMSTIARRLDTLGAITRGQRQTGGQGLFRPEDNLESTYARMALLLFYRALYAGEIEGCSLLVFQECTGLSLTDRDGSLKEDLPPVNQFLNRLLALRIEHQNVLFAAFEERLDAIVAGAISAGTYDVGVETLKAESFRIDDRRTIYVHPATGAETRAYRVVRRDRNTPYSLEDASARGAKPDARFLINEQSGRVAILVPAPSRTTEEGRIERRVRLLRPLGQELMGVEDLARSQWTDADPERFAALWEAEVAAAPAFTERSFHIVTGLLLPIWTRLPAEAVKVNRLQTDDGERVIGRLLTHAALGRVYDALGVADAAPKLSPEEAWRVVLNDNAVLRLGEDMSVRRSRVMGVVRVELLGFASTAVDALKALGLMSEIAAYKLRLFLPVGMDANGPEVLGRLIGRYGLLRCDAP